MEEQPDQPVQMDIDAGQPDQSVQADIGAGQPDQSVQADVSAGLPKPRIKDILSRLPVKSLVRFSSVCRSWKDIISDIQFVNEHLERSLQNYRRQKLCFASSCTAYIEIDERKEDFDSDHDDFDTIAPPFVLPFMVLKPGNREVILGSCNGLVCLVDDHKIHFYNPSTGEYKTITGPHGILHRASASFWGLHLHNIEAHGFGYDSSTDDYKITLISRPLSVYVYSLRKHDWEQITGFRYGYIARARGTFFQGALHWVVCSEPLKADHCRLIVGFDLATEKFWEMPTPDLLHSGCHFILCVMREHICLFYECFERPVYDFWQLNVYGDSTSWTRHRLEIPYMRLEPLCSREDSEILLVENNSRLISYDVGSHKSRGVRVNGRTWFSPLKAIAYLETLVSPNTYREEGTSQ